MLQCVAVVRTGERARGKQRQSDSAETQVKDRNSERVKGRDRGMRRQRGRDEERPRDERWGAGVEYHFQEFNEPYAPS